MSASPLVPDFVSIGHLVHDEVGQGVILGGPAVYSALTAKSLGQKVGIVTSAGGDFNLWHMLDGVELSWSVAEETTTFKNIYIAGRRRQIISGLANKIEAEDVPEAWFGAKIVLICPVANEVGDLLEGFKSSTMGISAQGYMRSWNAAGEVSQKEWEVPDTVLRRVDAIVFSELDPPDTDKFVARYAHRTKMIIVTRAAQGADLCLGRKKYHIPAFPIEGVDATGAGDVFGAAFLVKLAETEDPILSARFATCAASYSCEKEGVLGIPSLEMVEHRQNIYDRQSPWPTALE